MNRYNDKDKKVPLVQSKPFF